MQWLPAILILPYFFILLDIYRGLLKIKPFRNINSPITFVSVIVACRNEEHNILSLLNHLNSQNYPAELYEVIVIDDNSSDNTRKIASSFNGKMTLRIIENRGSGKKRAIETAAGIASGHLIITTDADCSMGINWIRAITSYYEYVKADLIICPVRIGTTQNIFGRFQQLEFLSLQGVTAGAAANGNPIMCNGANLAFPRKTYMQNKNNLHFEVPSGDDIFLLQSISKKNTEKVYWLESPDSMVTTSSSPSLASFLKQRNRWISKAVFYNDKYVIITGIVTFVTILLMIMFLIFSIFDITLLPVLLVIIVLKSIPDFLILKNTTARYGIHNLMIWFLPALIIYPFYVAAVLLFPSFLNKGTSFNYPFRKET